MNHLYGKAGITLALVAYSAAACAQTVDMNSNAYKTGHLVGQIVGVIVIAIVIKKVFFSSKG